MCEIRLGVCRADAAVARRIERREIAHVAGVPHVVLDAAAREHPSVPAAARRVDAIEQVDTAVDPRDQIAHGPDSHQIPRLRGRQQRGGEARHAVHLGARLADREPADRIAREVQRDELGAVEFFSGGAKLILIGGADGKLHPRDLEHSIEEVHDSKKTAVPACVSRTNATEAGTVYTDDEIRGLCEVARRHRLRVHLDGARFANAFVAGATDIDGVDILSFGASKNGTLAGDVIVVFNRALTEELSLRWHRAGQRLSKMRFLSAQLDAYFTNDLWLRNARQANAMARRLRDRIIDAVEIVRPVDANIVFVRCAPADGFLFGDWPIFGPDVYRIVMGFNTTERDVDELAQSLIRSRSVAT